jgi:hypothetical protein
MKHSEGETPIGRRIPAKAARKNPFRRKWASTRPEISKAKEHGKKDKDAE